MRREDRAPLAVAAILTAMLLLGLLLGGCPAPASPPCTPAETRCTEDKRARETCGSDGTWRVSMRCDETTKLSEGGRPFVCRAVSLTSPGVTCLPAMGDGFDP